MRTFNPSTVSRLFTQEASRGSAPLGNLSAPCAHVAHPKQTEARWGEGGQENHCSLFQFQDPVSLCTPDFCLQRSHYLSRKKGSKVTEDRVAVGLSEAHIRISAQQRSHGGPLRMGLSSRTLVSKAGQQGLLGGLP